MKTLRMPGFSAEESLGRSRTQHRASAREARPGSRGSARVQAAARPISYCSMKGCCIDLRALGFPRICCNGDECGPDVLI